MTLLEDVQRGYEVTREDQDDGSGPVTVIRNGDEELAPGFNGMRGYYENRLLAVCRRGYRHYAGSTLPTSADALLDLTRGQMLAAMIGTQMEAFTDGLLIGHQADHQVKISFHFDIVENLFSDEDFRNTSKQMALGFAEDDEVLRFFTQFLVGGLEHLSHITGFAHRQVDPGKVWDVWMLIGTACICSSYLAGHNVGKEWKERDVLSGIEIATQEVPRGPAGEA